MPDQNPIDSPNPESPASHYELPIVWALNMQAILLLVGSLMLDGGGLFRLFLAVSGAYWPIAIWIVHRRRKQMSVVDRLFVRHGLLTLAVLTLVVGQAIGAWR